MKKPTLITMTLVLGALISIGGLTFAGDGCPSSMKAAQCCPAAGSASKTALKAPIIPGDKLAVLTVSSMTSSACADKVTKSLTAIDGVDDVAVSLTDGAVVVAYNPTKVKPDQFAPAVVKAGYSAKMAVMDNKATMTSSTEMGSTKDGACETKDKACAPGH